MADLTPTPDRPGLHVAAEPIYRRHDDPARWWNTTASTPSGSYTCGPCGQSDTATGHRDVAALVDDYTANHGPAHARKNG
ncbi:hypothetical protein [Streptomyces tailanensis]|uniref:hypothetical protein n=1 Tax=Streptomyces tailanensis TaxID=2569858 RepID=UPI001FE27ECB|nr:hypothetical protein [Streptomyces tailanensis]